MKFKQLYSDEELIAKAREYDDFATLHKENRSLYDTIHRRRLEEKAYAHFSSWGRKTWSLNDALAKAEECGWIMKVFRKRYSGLYLSCKDNNWLDIVFPNRRKNKKAYTIADFRKSLSHAKSLKSWRKCHRYLSTLSFQKGWFVQEDKRLTDLAKLNGLGVFESRYARNIISNCAIIDIENIKTKALLCENRKIFKKVFFKHYQKAIRLKILSLVCSHMPQPKSRKYRAIYAAEFEDKHVYVGLSYDLEDRWDRHMRDKRSAVYKYYSESKLKPKFKMVHDYEIEEIAKVLEGVYKDKYKDEGWIILNRVKTGGLGASQRKLSEKYILGLVNKCNSYKDFRMTYGGAYKAAKKLGILMDIKQILEPQIKITRWASHPDLIEELASNCKSHKEFGDKYNAAARAAKELGIYDMITRHFPARRISRLTKEIIYSRIKDRCYKTYTDFTKDVGTYNAANRFGMLDEIKEMLPKKEKEPYYSIDYLHEITLNYIRLKDFEKSHHNLYEYIRTHNLADQLYNHFQKNEHRVFDDDFAISESKKYKNVTEIAQKDRTLYNYLREHNMLEITFPNRRRVVKNKKVSS